VAISSHVEPSDIDAGRGAGFDEYLPKSDPVCLQERLLKAIRAATLSRGGANDNLRRAS
jgi:CheY-like chemotaxis protein